VTSALNYNFALDGVNCSNSADLPSLGRHRWHFVKEAFSPVLVGQAMKSSECGEDDTILDPFCGSGTSLLAAASRGASAIGCEVNPFLAFVSRTKLSPGGSISLGRHVSAVRQGVNAGKTSPP
jgi:hypothetical protein